MYEPNPAGKNRYLYHWLSPERLERFAARGVLRPYWRHWIYDLGGFVKGVSTSPNPVDWMPREDEGVPGEPCIVIDRQAFEHQAVDILSSEAYHLTKDITRAVRSGKDIEPILERVPWSRQRTWATLDETFILTPVPSSAVAAIGYEPDRMYWHDLQVIRDAADLWNVPLIRMDGWLANAPDVTELDRLIESAIETPHERRYF
jgi:hypothetical protein